MADRRAVRNHLHSIHAVALANLAEVTSGLAVTIGLPASARGIPTTLSITYLKKARGTLTAEARCAIPDASREAEHDFESVISDAAGQVVARATVRWRIGPSDRKSTRLNSSHGYISYAVFCLKKKKKVHRVKLKRNHIIGRQRLLARR